MNRNPTVRLIVSLLLLCSAFPILSASADDFEFRRSMARAVRAATDHVMPSVVSIEVIGTSGEAKGEVEQDAPTTGVIVGSDGEILVSSIVVRRPSATILVVLPDGTRKAATVVARDYHRDLVLLKIKPEGSISPITFPDSMTTKIGETTVAIGRYGKDQAPMVSTGILSATERLDGIAIQTDARVPPAMYGGPLIDLYGNFLGLLIPAVGAGGAEDSTGWYDSGIAFAIPADVIAIKLDRLRKGEDIKKGLIGIVAGSRDLNELDTKIAAVRARSPAEASGLKAGDEVLMVDGRTVRRHQEIRQVLGRFDAGEEVVVRVKRDSEELDFTVTLADSIPPLQPQALGVVVSEPRSDESADQPEADQTEDQDNVTEVFIEAIVPDSPADGKLEVGDQLVKLGEANIDSVTSLRRKMISAEPDAELTLQVLRDDESRMIKLTPSMIAGSSIGKLPFDWQAGDDAADPKSWAIEEIKLPDAANEAAYLTPGEAAASERSNLGLVVLLLEPGGDSPQEALKSWKKAASQVGVAVCAVAPEDEARWQPKELELISKFAAAVQKKAPVDPAAIAVASPGALKGGKATAADSMAIAVAISQSDTFFGIAISDSARPPAVRVRENEASSSLQILMPIENKDELPAWSGAIEQAGYPVVFGGEVDRERLLRWVRLLQSI